MSAKITLTQEEKKEAFREINDKSDGIMRFVIIGYFLFGLFLATFYDTYLLALGAGGLCLLAYFGTRILLPGTRLYQYVISGLFAIFSAQFIYQMHGLFEMHFFFFVGSALLITYRNWKLIIPLLLLTVVHHATFAWLQYNGMKEIYFTQLDYMDLQAFIFHALLAAVIMLICGYWSYDLEKSTWREYEKNTVLARQLASVKNNIAFAEDISNGNLDTDYHITDQSDELGKSLLMMRDNLKNSSQRETEDKFITTGINRVSEIIRHHADDADALAYEIIKGIANYANLNQGGLFIEEEDDEHVYLKLAACYAYERKKFLQMRVNPGDGLIGQCFLEKEEIYMTAVPENYIRITSGLGDAAPRCILIVPVKTQDAVVGVMELASFRELKDYERTFIKKAAENIASAIVASRTTARIKKLLTESQQRAEELRAQEEEMRQNMEELSATQEEMLRKAAESENRINAIEESGIASIEFDLDGNVLEANRHFAELMGYTQEEIRGRHHSLFVNKDYARSEHYQNFWSDLRNGIPRPGEYERITKKGTPVFIKGSYSIIRDQAKRPVKVLKLAQDITSLRVSSEGLSTT